jgi:hypothetical protein
MPFDWKEYLDLAVFLQKQAGGAASAEALLRSAISRAYYGAFCHCRNYARDWLGFHPRNDADDHGRLREWLKQRRRRGVSDRLHRLREWRNECDYYDQLTFDPHALLGAVLAEAHEVFAALTAPAGPAKP